MAGFDISQAKGTQFSQELRLQSSFDGPVNFSVGANYTKFKTLIDYYVMYNLITAYALMPPFNAVPDGYDVDIAHCGYGGFTLDVLSEPLQSGTFEAACPYIDPNPVESIGGDGHNYFRSKNPYKLKSAAGFGEVYWNVTDDVKITAGLRYTRDRKTFIPVPSQVLLAGGGILGGLINRGFIEKPPIKQSWGEWTGKLGADWKPNLSFTDQTMLYASYSRGYKGGGANPPTPGFPNIDEEIADFKARGMPQYLIDAFQALNLVPVLQLNSVEYGPTFEPEFVNAYEIGAKNVLMNGALTFNAGAFFYDYKDYQVSQIRDRTAVNENFDAKIWGLEFETRFTPSRDFQVIANLGYLDSEIADGETSIDIMNRTQGDPNYVVVKPWPQLPSNCVVPTHVAEAWIQNGNGEGFWNFCGGVKGLLGTLGNVVRDSEFGNAPYDPANYPELNGGAGLLAHLGGNELPNAPHWTMNIGAQYGHEILDGSWRATVRADAYWQSQSWARVYNDNPYDKLHGWYNLNLSVWFERPDDDLKIELYAKNILDKTPITDSFLNSDDTALTTNVFVLDPRLIGLSIRKGF
jgi:outer membrane receptor protein involved in Fe transport